MSDSKSSRPSLFRAANVFLFAAAVAPLAFGCSSPSSTSPSPSARDTRSGLDESMQLTAATPAQLRQLCDWMATLFGGYGHDITKQCDKSYSATINAPVSQADCAATRTPPSCAATIAQVEDCEIAISSSDPCMQETAGPACRVLYLCSMP